MMQQQIFTAMNDFQESLLDSAKRFGELNQSTWEVLMQQQQQVLKTCLVSGQKNVQLLTQAKDPRAYMVLQSEMVRECGQTLVNGYHERIAVMDQARNEWIGLVEVSAEKTQDNLKKVTDLTLSLS